MTFKYNSAEERNAGAANVSTVEKHGTERATDKRKNDERVEQYGAKKSLFQSC